MSSLTAFFSERISLLSAMLSFLLLNFLQCFYHIILSFIRLLQSCLPLEISVFRAESQTHMSLCVHGKPAYLLLCRPAADKAAGPGSIPVFHSLFLRRKFSGYKVGIFRE